MTNTVIDTLNKRVDALAASEDASKINQGLLWIREQAQAGRIQPDLSNTLTDRLQQALDRLRNRDRILAESVGREAGNFQRSEGDARLLRTAERVIAQPKASPKDEEDVPEIPEVEDEPAAPATPDEAMAQVEQQWTQQDVEAEMREAKRQTGSRAYRAKEPVFLVKIVKHELGNDRTLRKNEYEVAGTSKARTRATKFLLDPKFFQPMREVFTEFDYKVSLLALPVPFRGGFKPIPISNMKKFYALLKEFRQRLKDLGESYIIPNYPSEVRKAAGELGPRFVASDYVAPKVAASKFGIDVDYYTPGVPEGLAAVGEEFLQSELGEAERQVQEMLARTEDALAASMEEMVGKLLKSVQGGKKFYDTDVTKFVDFLQAFGNRNITGNERLAELVKKADSVLRGVDVKDLKKDDRMKEYIGFAMSEVAEGLAKYVKDKPARLVSADDTGDELE